MVEVRSEPVSKAEEYRESLLRYSLRLTEELSRKADSEPLRIRAGKVVEQLGLRANLAHTHLLLLKKTRTSEPSASLFCEWSQSPLPEIRQELQDFSLTFLGANAVSALQSGIIVFTSQNEDTRPCSKLVSGMLHELNVSSYEMLPIIFGNRLAAILGVAHSNGQSHLDDPCRRILQLLGRILVQSVYSERQERRRLRDHREWKRVANGACDFALRLNSRLEIVRCIAFRQKTVPQVTGLLLKEFIAASSYDSLMEVIQSATQSTQPRSTDVRAIDVHGRLCSYTLRVEPSSARMKGELTLYLTNSDVERAHEEEMSSLREQLERATRLSLLGNLATEFAHQLTQPLQAINNHIYTLKSRAQKKQTRAAMILEMAEKIETLASHAGNIITGLRDYLHDRHVQQSAVCLKTMIENAVRMVEVQTERRQVKIEVLDPHNTLNCDPSVTVWIDGVQTTHVIINLLINAIEACGDAGLSDSKITIQPSRVEEGKFVLVDVSDNGPGIPPDKIDKVFDRFFTTKSEGFGFGLAICRDVIERQGGWITVRNLPDRGCCFSFTMLLDADDNDESSMDDFSEDDVTG